MKVHAYDKTIREIFDPQSTKYIVPRFQREYSWEKEHVLDLWHDTLSCIKCNEGKYSHQEYFIGSLVLVGEDEEGSDNNSHEFFIVDGQQRLTTITIFISALIEILKDENQQPLAKGLYHFIEGRDLNDIQIFKLINETPKPFFQNSIQYFDKKIETANSEEEKRLLSSYTLIVGELKSIKSEYSVNEDYIRYLIAIRDQILSLKTIFITVDNEEDAYTIFETLNARGINLKTIDLIKNTLFKSLNYTHPDDDARTIWKKIQANLSNKGAPIKINSFFRNYWLSKYQFCRDDGLYKSFKEAMNFSKLSKEEQGIRAKSFLDDLEKESRYYQIVSNPIESDWKLMEEKEIFESLSALKLFNVTQVNIISISLLAQYKNGKLPLKEFKKAVLFLENFHFLYSLSSKKTSSIESKYSKHAREIRQATSSNQSKQKIEKMISDFNKKLPIFEVFLKEFQSLYFTNENDKDKKIIQYIFKKWEKNLHQTDELTAYKITIEHIYPQKGSTCPDWAGEIGNLLPLSQPLNGDAETKPFVEKVTIYKKSELKIVKEFIERYGSLSSWGKNEINQRTYEMAKIAYSTIWKIVDPELKK